MSTESTKTFHVFISHSSQDAQWAQRVCQSLEARRLRCWIAPRDIVPGSEWGAAIVDGIDRSRVVVLIFSNKANESAQVRREIERAISKSIPVLPMRIEDIRPQGALEFALSNTHWLDAFASPIEDRMQQLTAAVEALLGVDGKAAVKAGTSTTAADAKSKVAAVPANPPTGATAAAFKPSPPAIPASAVAQATNSSAPLATNVAPVTNKRSKPIKLVVGAAGILVCLCLSVFMFTQGGDKGETDGGDNDDTTEEKLAADQDVTRQFEGFWRADAESINGRVFASDHVAGRNLTLNIRDHSVIHRRQPTADSTLVINGAIEFGVIDGKPQFTLRGRDTAGVHYIWLGIYQATDDTLEVCFREAVGSNGKPARLRDLPKRPEQIMIRGERDTHYVRYQRVFRKPKPKG